MSIAQDIKVGSLVILNDSDQPSARMVVEITAINGAFASGRYLCIEWKNMKKIDLRYVTPIEKFGVSATKTATELIINHAEDSTATYSDGKPRRWQKPFPDTKKLI